MKKAVLLITLLLTGCASTYYLADGDRYEGYVTFVCDSDIFTTKCKYDLKKMQRAADRACKNWGYAGSDAFGGAKRVAVKNGHITVTDSGSVIPHHDYHYERRYQCVVRQRP